MKYTIDAKVDARVVEASPAPLPFPGKLDQLPTTPGVLVLCDEHDEVVYVTWGDSIRSVGDGASTAAAAATASRLRWFRTQSPVAAKAMGKSCVRRFKPEGNRDDSQWGIAPV